MSSFLQPDPVVLFFFTFKKFLYLEILALLCLLRAIVARGPSRWVAFGALALCTAGILTVLAPAMGVTSGTLYVRGAQALAHGGGMTALLLTSAVMAISAVLAGVRWRWIDAAHAIWFAALCGLWWWVS